MYRWGSSPDDTKASPRSAHLAQVGGRVCARAVASGAPEIRVAANLFSTSVKPVRSRTYGRGPRGLGTEADAFARAPVSAGPRVGGRGCADPRERGFGRGY